MSRSEREATFEGTGLFDPQDLRLPAVVDRVREEPPEELDAIYYDTPDLRLLTRGITLRRRSGGHDAGWHLKLPTGGPARLEVHAPLKAGKGRAVPGELLNRTTAYVRGRPLVPVAHLRTHRRRHLLLDKRERCLAEVAQDAVAAQTLAPVPERGQGEPPSGGRAGGGKGGTTRITQWSEIEVELVDGDAGLLDAAAQRLDAAGWHPAATPRKLDRALADELAAARPGPGRGARRVRAGSVGEAVMDRLGTQVDALLRSDAGTRADAPDALHQMRSAARRLRDVLRAHRRVLDRSRTDRVAGELHWLVGALADARDHEVLARRLPAQATRLRQLDPDPAVRAAADGLAARLREQEGARHAAAWGRAVAALGSARYFALLDDLDGLLADPPLRRRARRPAGKQLRKAAEADRRRLLRRLAAAERGREQALHQVRKAARRARHTAEVALPYGGKRARRLRKRTKKLQQLLGDHQDAVVARRTLVALAEEAHGTGTDTFGYGLLYAMQAADMAEAARGLPRRADRATAAGLSRFA
ncbi:CYTH and CHAD domain-containing protein [Streptomyces sp. NRRL F-5123]|uniref:CYTH and CHAD domain-containing protein n=1 Tax=Streptomyces sp. NRRL F-5123 TaxID=1463856 RepID=UPI0004E12102|nr:CYTH and CHAD domain-containing protein [Streptomyces sp. NRRL F-5123]